MKNEFLIPFVLITIFFISGCNQPAANNDVNNTVNNTIPETVLCNFYKTNSGIFINNTGSVNIEKLSVSYKVDWIDSYDNGLVEKHNLFDKSYDVDISPKETKIVDNLSVCLPEERKGKSNIFKCTANVHFPCKSSKTFAVAYNYYENKSETFTSPPLDEYISMYKTLKEQFG
jgi:hypothetical protein